MGAGYYGGFGSTVGQQIYQEKINAVSLKNSLIDEKLVSKIEEQNVKFTKKDLVFITKDKVGQIIFLEKGNCNAGLKHIQDRHAKNFKKSFDIKENDISIFLYTVITNGNIVDSHEEIRNGKKTKTKVYDYQCNYYILTRIGTNGFIVTARPAKKERK